MTITNEEHFNNRNDKTEFHLLMNILSKTYEEIKPPLIKDTELMHKRYEYYLHPETLKALLYCMRNKEVVFIHKEETNISIRGYYFEDLQNLKDNLTYWLIPERNFNIYISNAYYTTIPKFSGSPTNRITLMRDWFVNNIDKIYNYDMLLDFDNPIKSTDKDKTLNGFYIMLQEIIFLTDLFNSEHVPYHIIPSGKNFQIIIPSNCFLWERNFKSELNKIEFSQDNFNENDFHNKVLETKLDTFNGKIETTIKLMKQFFNLTSLDTKGVGVLRKIRKCPYSLVYDKVCYPIQKDKKINQYENLIIGNPNFPQPKEELYLFNDNGEIENKRNVHKFLNKYMLDGRIYIGNYEINFISGDDN